MSWSSYIQIFHLGATPASYGKKSKKKKETVQLFNLLAQLSKRKHILGWLSHKFHIHVCRQPNGVTVRSALLANQQWSVALPASTCNAGGPCMRMSVVKTCKKKMTHTHTHKDNAMWTPMYEVQPTRAKNFKKMKLEGDNQHSERKIQSGNIAHETPRETSHACTQQTFWQCSLNAHISRTFALCLFALCFSPTNSTTYCQGGNKTEH